MGAAALLQGQGGGSADPRRLEGISVIWLGGPIFRLLGWRSAKAGMGRMLSGNRGRGFAVRLGQGAEAAPYWDWREIIPGRQVLVKKVIIRVIALRVIWKEKKKTPDLKL